MNASELMTKAQQLINIYDEAIESLAKGQEMNDELIDEILGAEAESTELLQSLLLAKKVQAERRLIAQKNEDKLMKMINRIMRRARIDNYECEDGKIKGKIAYRFEIKDESLVPADLKAVSRPKVNSLIQKGEIIPGVEKGEGYLDIRIY